MQTALFINGEKEVLDFASLSVFELMKTKGLEETLHIALAVNGEIVTRQTWTSTFLKDGDQILIISPIQGG